MRFSFPSAFALSAVFLLAFAVALLDATGLPMKSMCCCCQQQAAPPPSSCCGRRKRQGVLSELMEWERRVACCTATGRKRRATGAPISKRLEFWALNHLGPKMF
ncbi:hypothetical protein niasHS_009375 [Heterodera schachtii]|uniref:Secreted protein n=2 Tax=Heterodera TaxID=34509 RepID=A0ABD2JC22_HETSC